MKVIVHIARLLKELFSQSMVFNKIGVCMVFQFACSFAHAQIIPTTPLPGTPNIKVTPLVANFGVSREIEISGVWPNGCGTLTATMDESLTERSGILVIRVVAPNISLASVCAKPPVNYKFTFNFVPPTYLTFTRIAPLFNDGLLRGYGRVVNTYDTAARSVGDVTGAWYEPSTNGSGFTFIHNYEREVETLFGTWYAYDLYGAPRWFVIDNVKWSEGGRTLFGNVSSTKATDACEFGEVACVARGSVDKVVGTIQIDFDGLELPGDVRLEGKVNINSLSGVPLYRGMIMRLGV